MFYSELILGSRKRGPPQKRFKDCLKSNLKACQVDPKNIEAFTSTDHSGELHIVRPTRDTVQCPWSHEACCTLESLRRDNENLNGKRRKERLARGIPQSHAPAATGCSIDTSASAAICELTEGGERHKRRPILVSRGPTILLLIYIFTVNTLDS